MIITAKTTAINIINNKKVNKQYIRLSIYIYIDD